MKPGDLPPDLFTTWEGAVAFRLFADQSDPTLTVSEQIAARVGDRILSGAMVPGARIGEQELADEFSVSRGPIREALRILEREGLATLLARRGAIVTELSADELRELLEIRAGLFEMVVRKIAARPIPALLSMLEAGVTPAGNPGRPARCRQRLCRDHLPPADPVRAPVRQPAAAAHADRTFVADAALQQAGPGLVGAASSSPPACGARPPWRAGAGRRRAHGRPDPPAHRRVGRGSDPAARPAVHPWRYPMNAPPATASTGPAGRPEGHRDLHHHRRAPPARGCWRTSAPT